LMEKCDKIFIGGGMAYTFFKALSPKLSLNITLTLTIPLMLTPL